MKKILLCLAATFLVTAAHAQTKAPFFTPQVTCDGFIIYSGVMTTSGSAVVTETTSDGVPYPHTFTSADIGATVTITNPAPINTASSSAPTAFTGTISSINSTSSVTLSATVSFTSASYQYAAMRGYKTDNKTALVAALTSAQNAGGGQIFLPQGVCATTGNLPMHSNITVMGTGAGPTVLMLANGSNSDLWLGDNFSALTGTNSTGGVREPRFQNLIMDGNRGANTATGAGTPTGTGAGFRVYGFEITLDNVEINYFAGDCYYSEWSDSAGAPIGPNGNAGPAGMEAYFHNLKCAYNGGYGGVYEGPHDSVMTTYYSISNGLGGALFQGNGSPVQIDHFHGYAEPGYDLDFQVPNMWCNACYTEGGWRLGQFEYFISNSHAGGNGLIVGDSGGGAAYELYFVNNRIDVFDNVTGSGFGDLWAGGNVGSFTGNAYAPSASAAVDGLDNYVSNGKSLIIHNGSSWPVKQFTDGGSLFHFQNGGADAYTVDLNQRFSYIGPMVYKTYTVSTLPTSPIAGEHVGVTDATACTKGSAPTGGGSTYCDVVYTGSGWTE